MKLLVTSAHPSLSQHTLDGELHPNLGRLVQPRHYSSIEATAAAGIAWAADNDGFNGVDNLAYIAMLDRLKGLPGCRFVTVPDVVRCSECHAEVADCGCESKARPVYGDARRTAEEFEKWAPALERRGLPVALVLQDGIEEPALQRWLERTWCRLDALFIGGSTEFKLGSVARRIAQEAKRRGKWVHWGRVNTRGRVEYVAQTGAADSFDGSSFARWRKTLLDEGLGWAREAGAQLVLCESLR